jgi:uncharacterized protein YbjT (DUF2867 family)
LSRRIFITGGTGYIGSRLIPLLVERGHEVVALVRPGSEHKLSAACMPVCTEAGAGDGGTDAAGAGGGGRASSFRRQRNRSVCDSGG